MAAQTVLVTSAQAKVPVSVGRAWGLGERQEVNGTASKRRWCPCPFDAETHSFVGRV